MLARPDISMQRHSVTDGLSLTIWTDLDQCKQDWLTLEANGSFGPVFQRFDWQKAWFETLGAKPSISPCIVMGYQGEVPVFVLPFAIICRKLVRRIVWSGGKQSNFNFGLFAAQIVPFLEHERNREDLAKTIFTLLQSLECDLIELAANPLHWQNLPHLFDNSKSQAGMTPAFGLDLTPGFETLFNASYRKRMRKKFRWQRRFLQAEGHSWRVIDSSNPADFSDYFDAFYRQKSERFKKLGIEDTFSQTDVQAFLDALAISADHKSPPSPVLHFYGLEVDGRLIATCGGASHNDVFSSYFISFDETYLPRLSAGEMLLGEMIRHRIELGDRFFDMGMGDERYKHLWCDQRLNYFTILTPYSQKGRFASLSASFLAEMKRFIRSNPRLWASYKWLRKAKARFF